MSAVAYSAEGESIADIEPSREEQSIVESTHDPLQCIKQLQQVLAADKLSLGFFLGAGCPCAIRVATKEEGGKDHPLIPDISGLTQLVQKKMSQAQEYKDAFAKLLQVHKEDGENNPTIEDMLNRVRALRDVVGKGVVRSLSASELDALDAQISLTISGAVSCDLPSTTTPYHALARYIGSKRPPSPEIFTTNYDLLMEQALEATRVPYFDGFIGSSRPFFDQRAIEDDALPVRWSRLWKLHGSINWRFNKPTKSVVRSRQSSDGDELLIHPSHRKYDESRRMPYFVMIDRIRNFLRHEAQPIALIIIGYSFSDDHLNEAIIESLKANHSAACFAFQYSELSKYSTAKALASENPNLSLYARDAAIIRRRCGSWAVRPTSDTSAISGVFEIADSDETQEKKEGVKKEDQCDPDAPRPCKFLVGDFGRFGSMLDEFSAYDAMLTTGQ